MAVIAAPQLPNFPTEPYKGAAVIIQELVPSEILVFTNPLIAAPNVYQLIAAANAYAV